MKGFSTAVLQIRAAAAFAGLKLDLPANYVHFEDNKKPEFLAKFPHGKIPALDGADGFRVFETSAIARYGESDLHEMRNTIRHSVPSSKGSNSEEMKRYITSVIPV